MRYKHLDPSEDFEGWVGEADDEYFEDHDDDYINDFDDEEFENDTSSKTEEEELLK